MNKINLQISTFPPFIQMKLEIPLEELFRNLVNYDVDKTKSAELVSWILEKIFEEQFPEGDAKGAWSIRYKEYLIFYFGSKKFPSDISIKDTITFSSWIARPLLNYCKKYSNEAVDKAILPRLTAHKEYLFRRFNNKIGGFGLPSQIKTSGDYDISVDLRHTAWAVLTLLDFDDNDPRISEKTRRTGDYLSNELITLKPHKERALTYAVLHQLITNEKSNRLLHFNKAQLLSYQKQIESVICEKYNSMYKSWDLEVEEKSRIRIINILSVLQSLEISSLVDVDLQNIVKDAIKGLADCIIVIDKKRSALPLVENTSPDIGASIQLLNLLIKYKSILDIDSKITKNLLAYVLDPANRLIMNKFAYPWHLAAFLELL